MFDRDDDLFDLVPDIDGDGDNDLIDYLIVDDILQEEEAENDPEYNPIDDEEDIFDDDEDIFDDEDEQEY